jgi:carbamoyl-phosphate synthase small subunit
LKRETPESRKNSNPAPSSVFPKIETLKKYNLILEDGSIYRGISFGSERSVSGEVVFNTGMVGYYESLTDPSYRGQILTFTYPLIGNYGVPGEKIEDQLSKYFESDRIHVSALIVSDYSFYSSHWNATKSLSQWLNEHKIPALFGIDTRALTKRLREKGTMLGKIVFDKDVDFYDPSKKNLVKEVSVDLPLIYNPDGQKKIILVDCGVKYNIIRSLIRRDCCVIRVPFNYDFFQYDFDAVVLSNGPGDPKMCQETIANVKKSIESNVPIFGICLGNQILALAAGANTYKLKYGHRSQNQPSLEVGTKRCYITSQNHGYAVETETLPEDWTSWFQNVNDGTNEGIRHKIKPCMSVQFHPEHTPGPVDTDFLFDDFLKIVNT